MFFELLDSALLFNHYRIMFVYREVNLTFDLTLAPGRDHEKNYITNEIYTPKYPIKGALHTILSLAVKT